MRLLVPVARCDGCNVDIDPLTKPITVEASQGGRARRLTGDLCETCAQTLDGLLDRAANLLPEPKTKREPKAAVTETAAPADRDSEKYRTCGACGFVSKSRNALGAHGRVAHNVALAEIADPLPRKGTP